LARANVFTNLRGYRTAFLPETSPKIATPRRADSGHVIIGFGGLGTRGDGHVVHLLRRPPAGRRCGFQALEGEPARLFDGEMSAFSCSRYAEAGRGGTEGGKGCYGVSRLLGIKPPIRPRHNRLSRIIIHRPLPGTHHQGLRRKDSRPTFKRTDRLDHGGSRELTQLRVV
jgi:hypothetical protein